MSQAINSQARQQPPIEEDKCSICLDVKKLDAFNLSKLIPCDHLFHTNCIKLWERSPANHNNSCPECRKPIQPQARLHDIQTNLLGLLTDVKNLYVDSWKDDEIHSWTLFSGIMSFVAAAVGSEAFKQMDMNQAGTKNALLENLLGSLITRLPNGRIVAKHMQADFEFIPRHGEDDRAKFFFSQIAVEALNGFIGHLLLHNKNATLNPAMLSSALGFAVVNSLLIAIFAD